MFGRKEDGLLWGDLRHALKSRHFRRKYGRLPPDIYYDRRYHAYVAPAVMDEFGGIGGDIETVCHALTDWNLCYGFEIHGEHMHTHSLDEVLRCAYNQAECFSIPKEYEPGYSAQELDWISRLVERGKQDRISSQAWREETWNRT